MRALILGIAALCLAACGITAESPHSTPPPIAGEIITVVTGGPAVIADRTTADETAGRAIEVAYKAARTAVELMVDTGLVRGEFAARLQTANRDAYAAVGAARAAYATANSRDWLTAANNARAAIAKLVDVARSR